MPILTGVPSSFAAHYRREDSTPAAAKHKPERTDKLGGTTFSKFHRAPFHKAAAYGPAKLANYQ